MDSAKPAHTKKGSDVAAAAGRKTKKKKIGKICIYRARLQTVLK